MTLPIRKFRNSKFEIRILKFNKGFTLIELLIVISIIAILLAAGVASWANAQQKARDGKRKADLKSLQQALESYFQINNKYPSSTTGQITCNITGDSTVKTWGGAFTCSSITYLQIIPKDPAYQSDTTKNFYYNSSSPYLTYVLSATLENTNDPDLNPPNCTPQGYPTRNYCVSNP